MNALFRVAGLSTLCVLVGCAATHQPPDGTTGEPPAGPARNVAGNWEFDLTPTKPPTLLTRASGSLSQDAGSTFVTASLNDTSGIAQPCVGADAFLALIGTQRGSELGLKSFVIDGQYVSLAGRVSEAGTSMTGNYAVQGGCADGATGNLSAQLFQPFTGTYTGQADTTGNPLTISLSVTQLQASTGDGRFLVSGTATMSGSSCMAQGSLNFPDGYVLGSTAKLLLHTNDPSGAVLSMEGSFPSDASSFNVASAAISGGACARALGPFTLKRNTP